MLPLYISNLAGYGRTNRIPLYVEEVAEMHPEKRFHSHTFSELVLVLRGEALHLVGEESFEVRRGDLLVLHPGAVHGYDKTGNFGIINLTYDYHKLSMPILDGYELPLFRRFFPSAGTVFSDAELCRPAAVLPEEKIDAFGGAIRALEQELNSTNPGNFYLSMAMFMSVMAEIARSVPETAEQHPEMSRLGGVIDYLYRNLTEPVSVEALAKMANLSRRTFFRLFRRMTGSSPQEYRTRLKLKMAVELLTSSELSIGEIAMRCGFSDSNYFCRVFREYLSTTPRQFRLNALKSPAVLRPDA